MKKKAVIAAIALAACAGVASFAIMNHPKDEKITTPAKQQSAPSSHDANMSDSSHYGTKSSNAANNTEPDNTEKTTKDDVAPTNSNPQTAYTGMQPYTIAKRLSNQHATE